MPGLVAAAVAIVAAEETEDDLVAVAEEEVAIAVRSGTMARADVTISATEMIADRSLPGVTTTAEGSVPRVVVVVSTADLKPEVLLDLVVVGMADLDREERLEGPELSAVASALKTVRAPEGSALAALRSA